MIKTKRGVGYAKSREFIEVQVSRSDDYESVIKEAMRVIRLEENGDEADLTLFRSDGTIIPNKEINSLPWTVGNYLRSMKKAASQVKLHVGVGYLIKVLLIVFGDISLL